jgi:phenylacetate-CoA ligase
MHNDRPYFQPEIETMSREQLAIWQDQLIQDLVSVAYERSPLYRGRWQERQVRPQDIRSVEDFRQATPFLTKKDLVGYRDKHGDPYCGVLCVEPQEVNNVGTTSGTTSEPLPLIELINGTVPFASSIRDMWGAGLRPGDKVLHPMVTVRGPQERTYQQLGCVPLMINVRHGADWEEAFRMIRTHKPALIYTFGPMISDLERLSQKHDLREIFSCLKFAVFSGEPLGKRMRARLRHDWGMTVYDVAGAGDTGVAWDCHMHDSFHLWDDYVYAECVDPATGQPMADGEAGELVCTALANKPWPLIRYRSGDIVSLDRSQCGCGRTHTRFRLLGRVSDKIVIGGVAVMPSQVWQAIEQLDATATAVFQILHSGGEEVFELRLRVGYIPRHVTSLQELDAALKAVVNEATGLTPIIELMTEAELLARSPSGTKLPRVVKS